MIGATKKLWHEWPKYFTVGVVIYLGVAALNVGDRVPDSPFNNGSDTPTTTSVSTDAGTFSFSVQAFRIVADRDNVGSFKGVLTIEVVNNTNQLANYTPGSLRLIHNGTEQSPAEIAVPSIGVSPHLGQLTPVTFPITSATSGSYTLTYQGHEIYSGYPR